jgi:hypothetical protein
MFLTTTEFLTGEFPNLPDKPTCFAVHAFHLVDDNPDNKPTYDKPLLEQKTSGYWAIMNQYRYLHNHRDGGYVGLGRHRTKHKITNCPTLKITKCAFSPWTEKFIQRKLSMKDHRDPITKGRLFGGLHHWWDRERLEKEYSIKKAI